MKKSSKDQNLNLIKYFIFIYSSDDKLKTLFSVSLLNLLQAKIEKDMNVNMNIFTILSRISFNSTPESTEAFNNPNETAHETYFDKVFNYVSTIKHFMLYLDAIFSILYF